MSRRRRRRGATRRCAANLCLLALTLSECLGDDRTFLLDVIEKVPGSAPLAPLVRQASEMAAAQSDQWRALAEQFRACAR